MFSRRFFIAWLVGAILMYSAFYCWHGMVLTDLSRIKFPLKIFLGFAAITYLLISFVIYKVYEIKLWDKITSNHFLKAIFTGISVGFLLFVVTTVLGISFSSRLSLTYLVTDCVWQIIEQTLGAMIVALCHIFIFVPEFEEH